MPGDPVVKSLYSQCRGSPGSIPGQGTPASYASPQPLNGSQDDGRVVPLFLSLINIIKKAFIRNNW